MSPLEDRFRIPGGSLDLDSDDDHENVTDHFGPATQASPPEPPTQIQSVGFYPNFLTSALDLSEQVAHLNPAELSRVLASIPHPLAPRTAEYLLVLNVSGIAFRSLGRSALNVYVSWIVAIVAYA